MEQDLGRKRKKSRAGEGSPTGPALSEMSEVIPLRRVPR